MIGIYLVPSQDTSCETLNNCHSNAKCIHNENSQRYECQCDPGYSGDGYICKKTVAACNVFFNCDPNADCVQDQATLEYHCQCREVK